MMKLPPALEKLSEIKHAMIIGIVLTFVADITLLTVIGFTMPDTGYSVLMIGLVVFTFLIPYIFGIRAGKKMAIIGIGIFLLVGAVNGPIVVHRSFSMAEPDPVSSEEYYNWTLKNSFEVENGTYYTSEYWISLDDGRLEPYRDEVGDFTFTITMYSNATFTQPPTIQAAFVREVWLDIVEYPLYEADQTDDNYVDGKVFNRTVNIENDAIYHHWFAVILGTTDIPGSLNTSMAMGPLVGDETGLYGFYAGIGTISMFCNIGMLFVIVVLLYWWLGTAKEKRERWDTALREREDKGEEKEDKEEEDKEEVAIVDEDEDFTCTECGAPVSASSNFCPNCGERFDGIEEEPAKEGESEEEKPGEEKGAE